jgi:hypothetical protein
MYDKLYEAAMLDFESVNILNENNLPAPAIYHCAQADEKCSKAIHAYYMPHGITVRGNITITTYILFISLLQT